MHAARISESPRLQRTLEALRANPAGLTTLEVTNVAGVLAVSATMAELRQSLRGQGLTVRCDYVAKTESGARVYRYRLAEAA